MAQLLQTMVLVAIVTIVSTEPPTFPNRYNTLDNSGNRLPLDGFNDNDWVIRPPTSSVYSPPDHIPDIFPTQQPHITQAIYGVPEPNQYPHHHGAYSYKPSSFFSVDHIKSQRVDVPRFDKPLFTPSSGSDFPATHGQVDNYNKALQNEALERLQQLQPALGQTDQGHEQTAFANGFTGYSGAQPAKGFVSVKFGQNQGHYNYQF